MTPPIRFSVVIPSLDAAHVIGQQLDALAGQTFDGDWEVVVVDNGSKDGTASLAESWTDRLPALRVVDASERQAHTYARNAGARAATGDWLLYCDADDIVAPGWVAAFASHAERHEGCDLMGGFVEDRTLNDPRLRGWRQSPPVHRL
ncbi:MAG: glycosyltransferase family 2 protein, partial [Acidimicrobiia bacterium]|nr:glycosyltransferase family 2 protein [Acidimicrobiia bacterium]